MESEMINGVHGTSIQLDYTHCHSNKNRLEFRNILTDSNRNPKNLLVTKLIKLMK